jgi:hypothetical protein
MERKANVSGYIVLKGAEHVATVRFSYPRDGAGKLVAMVADWMLAKPEDVDFRHFTRWQYGWANGYGYDKASAAVSGMKIDGITLKDDGWSWDRQLRDAGYQVIQAI